MPDQHGGAAEIEPSAMAALERELYAVASNQLFVDTGADVDIPRRAAVLLESGYSWPEVGDKLGISPEALGTVRARLERAGESLRLCPA